MITHMSTSFQSEEDRIDQLRLTAFKTNDPSDREAYFDATSKWFQRRYDRRFQGSYDSAEMERDELRVKFARAEKVIDLLESNARIQGKLLADTGRERDDLQNDILLHATAVTELNGEIDMWRERLREAEDLLAQLRADGGAQ